MWERQGQRQSLEKLLDPKMTKCQKKSYPTPKCVLLKM